MSTLYHTRAQLEARKKALNAELKTVNSEIAAVSDLILEQFAEDGASSVKLDSGATVYQHQQLRATVKAGDWERFADIAYGSDSPLLNELANMFERRINLNTLTAWVRERVATTDDPLPGPLADLITIIDKPTVRVRGVKEES